MDGDILYAGRKDAELSPCIIGKLDSKFPFAVILIDCRLQKLRHLVKPGEIDNIIVHLHRVGAVHGLDDPALKHFLHSRKDILLVIHNTPENLFSRKLQIRLHKYKLIAPGRNTPPRLNQKLLRSVSLSHCADILPVYLDMKIVLTRLLKGRVPVDKKEADKQSKQCSFNICKFIIFMILFLLFHLSSSPRPSRYKTYSSNIFRACKVGFREI